MATTRPSPAALGLAPLVLRLALGLLFTWAGLGKWMGTMPVKGEDAAVLANMGLVEKPGAAAPTSTPAAPASTPPAKPLPTPTKPKATSSAGGSLLVLAQTGAGQTGAPTSAPAPPPVSAAPPVLTAADFPEPVQCRAMWGIALSVYHAAHPTPPAMALWPRAIGEGVWPKCFAAMVFVCELGGGLFLLVGLFTRLSAFAVAGVMIGAMWLTQFGPAMQSGNAVLGFLPAHDAFDARAWQTLTVQVLALAAAVAVMCLGSGALALDRAFAGFRSAGPSRPASSSPVATARQGGTSGR